MAVIGEEEEFESNIMSQDEDDDDEGDDSDSAEDDLEREEIKENYDPLI